MLNFKLFHEKENILRKGNFQTFLIPLLINDRYPYDDPAVLYSPIYLY